VVHYEYRARLSSEAVRYFYWRATAFPGVDTHGTGTRCPGVNQPGWFRPLRGVKPTSIRLATTPAPTACRTTRHHHALVDAPGQPPSCCKRGGHHYIRYAIRELWKLTLGNTFGIKKARPLQVTPFLNCLRRWLPGFRHQPLDDRDTPDQQPSVNGKQWIPPMAWQGDSPPPAAMR